MREGRTDHYATLEDPEILSKLNELREQESPDAFSLSDVPIVDLIDQHDGEARVRIRWSSSGRTDTVAASSIRFRDLATEERSARRRGRRRRLLLLSSSSRGSPRASSSPRVLRASPGETATGSGGGTKKARRGGRFAPPPTTSSRAGMKRTKDLPKREQAASKDDGEATEVPPEASQNAVKRYVGRSIRKFFPGHGWYDGRIVGTEELAEGFVVYNVYYDQDGDEEQIDKAELRKILVEHQEEEKKDAESPIMAFDETEKEDDERMVALDSADNQTSHERGCGRGRNHLRRSTTKRVVNYMVDHLDENEFTDSSDEDAVDITRKRTSASKNRSRPRSRRSKNSIKQQIDEDSDYEQANAADGMGTEEDDDDSFDDDLAPTQTKRRKTTAKSGSRGKGTGTSSGNSGTKKKSMAESCDPINAPPYPNKSLEDIQKNHSYLDPCGLEATDGIIDRLVGDMVDRIGSLWQRSLADQNRNGNLGGQKSPLQLGTACSGTDAPALALTLLKEQLQLRQAAASTSNRNQTASGAPVFSHTHVFSCENEAFKSAYLARNFDSTLYPDIARLCDDPPRDVYGRPQPIGDFNLFVAGTSCKNFSMLRSNRRIDIEDKGCSGETFIAAIELLFKAKPRFAIFENVTGAPWEKMSEYITGRIKLSSSSDSKAIKDIPASEKKRDLTFVLEKGKIIVDHVPGIFGVRCGSIVKGYLRGETSTIRKVKFPATTNSSNNKSKTCSLKELLKANGISREKDTLVFDTGVTYCTKHMKVDTKKFGLPQTRQRVYMFVWQPGDGSGGSSNQKDNSLHDDLGEYWEAIVRHLESPVRHSLESFVLQPDHDIIRVFREALNGPPGRTSKRSTFLAPDFW